MSNTRKCIVTHKLHQKEELIRIVKTNKNEYEVNSDKQGRGAYVSKDAPFEKIKSQMLLNRTFRTSVPKKVYDELEKVMEDKHGR